MRVVAAHASPAFKYIDRRRERRARPCDEADVRVHPIANRLNAAAPSRSRPEEPHRVVAQDVRKAVATRQGVDENVIRQVLYEMLLRVPINGIEL